MKRILYNIIVCGMAVLPFLTSCDIGDIPGECPDIPGAGSNSIILDIFSGTLPVTRAEAAGAETVVDYIDVLIFTEAGEYEWHERVYVAGAVTDRITLNAERESFDPDIRYWVYLVANSTHPETDFEGVDLNGLRAMTQTDRDIHLTGLSNVTGAPESFLMDGIAYLGENEPASASAVVLNDGDPANDTELKVTLRRAAAKIVVYIKRGDAVTFDSSVSGAGYYLSNMPYSTTVLAGVDGEASLRTPDIIDNDYFAWTEDQITVTAYTYAHEWADDSALERETRLVVNVPLSYVDPDDPDAEPVPRESNYYQIPVSKGKALERNTYYEVTVTVNAPGAENPSEPVELANITYSVLDWTEKTINIGGETDRPVYLTLNKDEMEMHNSSEDNTTLTFASSSDVTARITRVYYIDKFGQEQNLENIDGDEYGINTGSEWRPSWSNRCEIRITPDEGLNGNIAVYSTIPENNTIRYIEFEVANEDDVTPRMVTVAQYPLTYITNVEGWYSYRDDFVSEASDGTEGVTTWELLAGKRINKGTRYTTAQVPYNDRDAWICGCSWNSNRMSWSYGKTETGFFGSKIAYNFNPNTGLSNIGYIRWSENRNFWNNNYSYDTWYVSEDLSNHRMYHVTITVSSSEYTLGKPRLNEDGFTDGGADNAELVSPSFMLASQLGAVMAIEDIEGAAQHCERYVEVSRDGTVYDDWRLPTRAEIMIIYEYQNDSEVMDEVLAGDRYWSASGLVNKPGVNRPSDQAIRCIRDAYGDVSAGN